MPSWIDQHAGEFIAGLITLIIAGIVAVTTLIVRLMKLPDRIDALEKSISAETKRLEDEIAERREEIAREKALRKTDVNDMRKQMETHVTHREMDRVYQSLDSINEKIDALLQKSN